MNYNPWRIARSILLIGRKVGRKALEEGDEGGEKEEEGKNKGRGEQVKCIFQDNFSGICIKYPAHIRKALLSDLPVRAWTECRLELPEMLKLRGMHIWFFFKKNNTRGKFCLGSVASFVTLDFSQLPNYK